MSDTRAIAAVTLALRQLLLRRVRDEPGLDLPDLQVTTAPPDEARRGVSSAQLNLFLLQATPNAAWRNLDPATRQRPGEARFPPLALDLHYLLTAYGRDEGDRDAVSHRAMGAALAALHDQPLLGPEALRGALETPEPLPPFIERLRVTPSALGAEEISKLWAAFQTQYRLSAAFQATVVLIESRRERATAPPVLRRGEDDRGPAAFAERTPAITGLRFTDGAPAVRLGETLVAQGTGLGGGPELVLTSQGDLAEIALGTAPGPEPDTLAAALDPTRAGWRAGLWLAALRRRHPDGTAWTSNAVSFALVPAVHEMARTPAPPGRLDLALLVTPPVAEGQRVSAHVAEVSAEPFSAAAAVLTPPAPPLGATRLTFRMPLPRAGTHAVRLRVDGVESLPFLRDPGTGAFVFDPAQSVTVP